MRNPFFEISQGYRTMLIVYFLLWRIMPEIVMALRNEAASGLALGATLGLDLMIIGFSMLPFLVRSFGGLPMGWLNPLALASILSIVKTTIQRPLHVVEPLFVWFREPVVLKHEVLTYWSLDAIQWVEFKLAAMWVVALLAYHLGFYVYKTRRKPRPVTQYAAPTLYFVAVYALLVAAFLVLISLSGGLQAHFAELSLGRFKVRESTGLLLVAVGFMPFLLVIWYLLKPTVLRLPVFWIMLVIALALQFASDGSRSSVLIPLVVLAAGWMYRTRKVPATTGIVGMAFAIIALATLGTIRTDARDTEGEIDFVALSSLDIEQIMQKGDSETAARNWRSAPIAIAALVPKENEFLYGQTYIGAVSFWIPRTIWSEKPRGSGAHANAILFLKRASADGFTGAAYPVNGTAEAFWNFGWFGIIVIYALFGAFHKLLSIRVMQRPDDAKYVALLLLAIIFLSDMSTDLIVPFLQLFVLLQLTFFGLKLFRPTQSNSMARRSSTQAQRV